MSHQPQRHSEAMHVRVSPAIRQRLDAQVERYDQTITSLIRIVIVIGLEALERMAVEVKQLPDDSGPSG